MTYIRVPFAQGGDRTPVPMNDPGDGSLSFQTGYGPLFSENPETSTTANRIGRLNYNGVEYRVTFEIRQYQQRSVPEFITATENNGAPFPYSISSRVRYNPGTGVRVYESRVNSNTELPTVAANWFDVSTVLVSGDALSNILGSSGIVITGTGATRTVSLDINGITTNSTIADNHFLPFSSGVDNRKTTISNFIATFITKALIDPLRVDAQTLGGNQASAFVTSSRFINTDANSGLAGGGNLSSDRSLILDPDDLTSSNASASSEIPFSAGPGAPRKTTLNQAISSVVNSGFINNLSGVDADTVGGAALSTLARTSTTVTGINGLSGGGNLSGNRQLFLDIADLVTLAPELSDYFAFSNSSISGTVCNRANLQNLLDLDQPGKTFTSAVTVQGLLFATDLESTSDERLKTEIGTLDPQHSLDSVLGWRKVIAEYNDKAKPYVGEDSGGPKVSIYAQDVQETHPEMTSEMGEGYIALSYTRLPVVLASAVEALSKKLDESNERIRNLEEALL